MKYLKEYKIFESSDVIDDIQDILLELKDIGFSTSVNESENKKRITIEKPKDGRYILFKYNVVEEVINRIKDYLKQSNILNTEIEILAESDHDHYTWTSLHKYNSLPWHHLENPPLIRMIKFIYW